MYEITAEIRGQYFEETGILAEDKTILQWLREKQQLQINSAMNILEETEFSDPDVYEWRFAYRDYDGEIVVSEFYTDIEAAQRLENRTLYQKLEFTKQVRQS